MHALPLNRDRSFDVWPPFDPGHLLDTNASVLRLSKKAAWAVFTRYSSPPVPGRGSIWAVRVDAALKPIGRPISLLGDGIDPRVIKLGARILVFFSVTERDAAGLPNGCSVGFAEFSVKADAWTLVGAFNLPKHPVEGRRPADSDPQWDKNWVPFPIDETRVGLIYAHDPWDVITLNVGSDRPQLEGVVSSPGITWRYGSIRGGTPPVRYDDDHLVTFFHAALTMGSRRIYSVGACVMSSKPPYNPVRLTMEPLLMAPYKGGVHRFGWRFAASVVFALGAEPTPDGDRLTAGLDDGEVGTFLVTRAELEARLTPPAPRIAGSVHDYSGGAGARLPLKSLLYVPDPIPGIPELPMIDFIRVLAGPGRTFVDVGAHIGFYTMGLAPGFSRVIAFEPSRFQYGVLSRNRALNDYSHVQCEHVALGDTRGEAKLHVLSYEGGLNTLSVEVASGYHNIDQYIVPVEVLDDRKLDDVDLMKIDVEGFEIPVLRGAAKTIHTCRPVILIEVWTDPVRRREVEAVMTDFDYCFEPLFPMSPELVLCLPRERRQDYAWFV